MATVRIWSVWARSLQLTLYQPGLSTSRSCPWMCRHQSEQRSFSSISFHPRCTISARLMTLLLFSQIYDLPTIHPDQLFIIIISSQSIVNTPTKFLLSLFLHLCHDLPTNTYPHLLLFLRYVSVITHHLILQISCSSPRALPIIW